MALVLALVLLVDVVGLGGAASRAVAPTAVVACAQRLPLSVPNPVAERWSPDGTKLALVWFARVPSIRNVSGYYEEEVLDVLDLSTGALRPVGVGSRPKWSASGRYLAYWGPYADEVRVVRDGRIVARLEPRIPEYGWVGDTLLFVEGIELRAWSESGGVRTAATFPAVQAPVFPQDDVQFSGDGRRLLLTRYFRDGTLRRYVGPTDGARLDQLGDDTSPFAEWAPRGSILLLRDAGRMVVRDLDAGTTDEVAIAPDAVHVWGGDGRTLFVGRVSPTVPGGDALDVFEARWPAAGAAVALPNVVGARAFSPDGSRFVGVVRDGREDVRLAVYGCGPAPAAAPAPDPDAAARLARIATGPGRFVRPAAGDIAQFVERGHTGIDVAAPFGSLIVAADDGVVGESGWIVNGGNRVCVEHAGGLESCYFHASAPLVTVGQRVVRGQPIALIGLTGLSTGPHVHWEAHLDGRLIDPLTR